MERSQHALLSLAIHDDEIYRADCAAMLRQSGESRNADELHLAAWTVALAPGAPAAEIDGAIRLARNAVQIDGGHQLSLQRLGAALYRGGRFDEALAALDRSSRMNQASPASAWYFLAMAHFQLGHADEARRWYDKGAAFTQNLLADPAPVAAVPWARRLAWQLLDHEASTLLGFARERETEGRPDPVQRPQER